MKRRIVFVSLIALIHGVAVAQLWDKSNGCIADTLKNTDVVFTRFEIEPMFRGSMKWFLTKNISLDMFLHHMEPSDTLFADTARIKFIMSKKGEISNVSISRVRSQVFQAEAMRLFRLSSCSWQVGEQGGKFVNGWGQFEIYFRLTRKFGEVKMNVDYKQIVPVQLDM